MRKGYYPRDKMANHEDDGSLAQELWSAIHPFAYRGIVPYIGKYTGVKPKDFEQHVFGWTLETVNRVKKSTDNKYLSCLVHTLES